MIPAAILTASSVLSAGDTLDGLSGGDLSASIVARTPVLSPTGAFDTTGSIPVASGTPVYMLAPAGASVDPLSSGGNELAALGGGDIAGALAADAADGADATTPKAIVAIGVLLLLWFWFRG